MSEGILGNAFAESQIWWQSQAKGPNIGIALGMRRGYDDMNEMVDGRLTRTRRTRDRNVFSRMSALISPGLRAAKSMLTAPPCGACS